MDFGFVLSKLCVLFFAMGAAFLAAKGGILKESASKVLSKTVVYIVNPMMVIASAMNNSHVLSTGEVFNLTGIACLCYAFLIVTAKAVILLLHLKPSEKGLYQFLFIFSNIGFFGMPVVKALFGEDAVFLVSMYMLPFQCLTFTYGIVLVSHDREYRKFTPKMLLHPMIIATLLAYVIYLVGIPMPDFLTESVVFLGDAASPLAMVVVGVSLAYTEIRDVFGNYRLYILLALKMVLVPLLVLFVLRSVLPDTQSNRLIIAVSTTVMAMPTAANSVILATQYHGDVKTASGCVFLSTLFSALTVPFLMTLL